MHALKEARMFVLVTHLPPIHTRKHTQHTGCRVSGDVGTALPADRKLGHVHYGRVRRSQQGFLQQVYSRLTPLTPLTPLTALTIMNKLITV